MTQKEFYYSAIKKFFRENTTNTEKRNITIQSMKGN